MVTARKSNVGRLLIAVGATSVLLSIGLMVSAGRSTMCVLPPDDSTEGGCSSEYVIDPLNLRLGEWFGPVGGAILVTAVLFLIFGAGWLLQRYMDKRAAQRADAGEIAPHP